jgi:hypothetical protein
MDFLLHDPEGYIVKTLFGPNEAFVLLQPELSNPGWGWLVHDGSISDEVHYVDLYTLTVLEKQDFTLESLPLPCTVTIEGVEYPVTEQPTFEFSAPGIYLVQVDAGPAYLKKEFSLDYQP